MDLPLSMFIINQKFCEIQPETAFIKKGSVFPNGAAHYIY